FDMDYLSVNDVMIPKNEIQGINLNDNLDNIIDKLQTLNFTHIPCYKDSIDNILGFLDINTKAEFISEGVQNINFLKKNLEAPLFILENTTLSKQLGNFQKETRRVGLIVDEYGDVQGLITLRDLIEEIVGKITADSIDKMDIMPQADGSFMLEGSMMIREINKRMNWDLPTDGPKTLSGLILETAQSIPEKNVGISMGAYRFETVLIKDNVVKLARAEKLHMSEKE
ncbi:MAG: CBS domain-containing protein, partial [Candidatus Marinimicrobia bacterium]|nr:CBS domain-containing protein [Candidatus Neomarinimicrobiota bacterium]